MTLNLPNIPRYRALLARVKRSKAGYYRRGRIPAAVSVSRVDYMNICLVEDQEVVRFAGLVLNTNSTNFDSDEFFIWSSGAIYQGNRKVKGVDDDGNYIYD